MPFKSRVKSRVHTRDLKGLLIKKKYKTNVLIIDIDLKEVFIKNTRQMSLSVLKVDKKHNSSQVTGYSF